MSTRWYPLYQKGNPQRRVFLPNFWLKLVKPALAQPENVVQFQCSMEMTLFDVKNYLEKIYNVPVIQVRTRIASGQTKRRPNYPAVIKEDDVKYAYVTMPKDQSFTFPNLFEDAGKEQDENMKTFNETKERFKEYLKQNDKPGMPGWYSV